MDVTVVIRGTRERTEQVYAHWARQQAGDAPVHVIHETPFSAAVRKTYELGIQEGRKWTLALDADILMFSGAMEALIAYAEAQPETGFEFQGRILDKFFMLPRDGGPHLYRTSLLPEALSLIPKEGSTLRPESHVFGEMKARGNTIHHNQEVFGIHDFEQYYEDIYRKAFLYAHKHTKRKEYFPAIWQELAAEDQDYEVALWGLAAGQEHEGRVYVDYHFLIEEARAALAAKGLVEKGDYHLAEEPNPADVLWSHYQEGKREHYYQKTFRKHGPSQKPQGILPKGKYYARGILNRLRGK